MGKGTMAKRIRELGYEVKNKHGEIKFDDSVFDSIDSEEQAYWLGFIYADGNVRDHKSSKLSYSLVIALKSTDIEHLKKFCKFLNYSDTNIKIITKKLNDKEYSQCVLQANSKHLWESLNSLGVVPNKSLIVTFPSEEVFKDKSLIKHFIRGYFDGDGCLSYYKRTQDIVPHISYVGTKDFIEKSSKYFPCNLTLRVREYSKIEDKNLNDLYEVSINIENSRIGLDWIYKDSNIYLDRKYKRY